MYIKDVELFKEIVISKGKGKLTPDAEKMLILICENLWKKFDNRIPISKRYDVYMNGVEVIFKQWNKFDCKKYEKALPYYTEIVKRAFANGYNKIVDPKRKEINFIYF